MVLTSCGLLIYSAFVVPLKLSFWQARGRGRRGGEQAVLLAGEDWRDDFEWRRGGGGGG